MNPLPVTGAMLSRFRVTLAFFLVLIAFAVALGLAITALERGLRQGSARASDQFDLVVGAAGSINDLVLSAVYLQTSSLPLLSAEDFATVLATEQANFVAPIAFGDRVGGYQAIGTTADLVEALSDGDIEGAVFATRSEAVIGAGVALALGDVVQPEHLHATGEHDSHSRLTIVGRMAATGTPWDNAVLVPIEQYWSTHGLPTGHPPDSAAIGPPYDPGYLAGVPAAIVDVGDIGAAYGLRNVFRTETMTAVFPAEVLSQLYGFMADGRDALLWVVTATQALILVAILAGLALIVQLYAPRLALLRALGASRLYVAMVVWLFSFAVLAVGIVLGLALGAAATLSLARYAEAELGIAMPIAFAASDFGLALLAGLFAVALSVLPALASYRRSVLVALSE